jgi:hypothetical protein
LLILPPGKINKQKLVPKPLPERLTAPAAGCLCIEPSLVDIKKASACRKPMPKPYLLETYRCGDGIVIAANPFKTGCFEGRPARCPNRRQIQFELDERGKRRFNSSI